MKNKGITLITLIVTIIILIILAGITIGMISGDNSIIKQAKNAKTQTNIAQEKEILQTASLAAIGKEEYGELNKDKVDNELDKMIGNDAYNSKDTKKGIKVTFTSSGRNYLIDKDGNVEIKEPVILPEGLQIGSIVTYEPTGSTYKWQGKYATTATITTTTDEGGNTIENTIYDTELDSRESGNARITSWKVFKIDEEEGEVQLVPATLPTNSSTTKVSLQGSPGYNNGVKLLNDACKELYSYTSKGITARNINIEDIESVMNQDILETEKARFTNTNISYSYLDNNNQVNTAFSKNKSYYPLIYEQEYKSVIDEEINTNGLKLSESPTNLIERNGIGIKSGKVGITTDVRATGSIQATNNIKPYQTYYNTSNKNTFREALGTEYADILAPYSNAFYWISSRCILVNSSSCIFRMFFIENSCLENYNLFESGGNSYINQYALLPVISLDSKLIILYEDNFKVNL